MIKNIVFDLGNVLIKFDPAHFMRGYSEEEKALYLAEIYQSENWLKMDRGELSEEELIELVCSRIPEQYHGGAVKLIQWYWQSIPIEGMEQLAGELRKQGYGIYLLSNTSQAFYKYYRNLPVFQHFDDVFVSADHGLLKPEGEIFRLFCKNFGLEAEECVFIDDTAVNVESAAAEGFLAIHFKGDVEELRAALKRLDVL